MRSLLLVFSFASASYFVSDSAGSGQKYCGVGTTVKPLFVSNFSTSIWLCRQEDFSGGGATSRLLVSYNASIKASILDVLFKPGLRSKPTIAEGWDQEAG